MCPSATTAARPRMRGIGAACRARAEYQERLDQVRYEVQASLSRRPRVSGSFICTKRSSARCGTQC